MLRNKSYYISTTVLILCLFTLGYGKEDYLQIECEVLEYKKAGFHISMSDGSANLYDMVVLKILGPNKKSRSEIVAFTSPGLPQNEKLKEEGVNLSFSVPKDIFSGSMIPPVHISELKGIRRVTKKKSEENAP